jgi:hypothetical protein
MSIKLSNRVQAVKLPTLAITARAAQMRARKDIRQARASRILHPDHIKAAAVKAIDSGLQIYCCDGKPA